MNVTRSMVKVENLPSLSYGAEQGVVAALPLLLTVETDGGSFGMPTGAENGAIEIQSHAAKLEKGQAIEDDIASKLADLCDSLRTNRAEHSADRSDIGKFLEAEQAKDHWILAVIGDISQLSISQEDMDDQAQKLDGKIVSGHRLDVPETGAKSILELEVVEKSLEDDQAGERAELLIGEFDLWESSGLTLDLLSDGGLLWLVCGFLLSQIIPEEGRHFASLKGNFCILDYLTNGEVIQHQKFSDKSFFVSSLRGKRRFCYATGGFIYTKKEILKSKPELRAFLSYYLRAVPNFVSDIGYFAPGEEAHRASQTLLDQ